MAKYRPYKQYTAHGLVIGTLEALFENYDKNNSNSELLQPIVVFTAFAIESYINHLGAEHISIWEDLERLPWKKKISILYKLADKVPNWGTQPLQFAQQVFTLRDKLAHGKPEIVYGPYCDTEDEDK